MENIDDFMKKKMLDDAADGGQRFEFREEYWLQAESLIVAQEQRKRRRRFFWWLSSGFLLLALSVGAWQTWFQPNAGNTLASSATPGAAANQTLVHHNSNNTGNTNPAKDTLNTQTNLSTRENNPSFSTQQQTLSSSGQSGKAGETPTAATTQPKSGRNNADNRQHGKADGANKSKNGLPSGQQELRSGTARVDAEKSDRSSQGSDAAAQPTAAETTRPASGTDGKSVENEQPVSSGTGLPTARTVANLDLLPTLLRYLQPVPPRLPNVVSPAVPPGPVAQTEDKPAANRKLHIAALAFGSVYAPAASTQRWGAGAGVSVSWRIGNSWAIQAAPMWRMRTMGAFAQQWDPQNSSQLRYSFGYDLTQYSLESAATHWLEIPVGVLWRQLPWTAEAGIAPGHLLVVQGRKTTSTESSLSARKTTREFVKLDKSPFYNNYVAVYAGGQYALTRRLNLGVRMYYLGGDFRRPSDEYTPPRQTLWVDAGLRLTLF